ncbi:HutD-family protein [Streptomyces sp. CB03234]|uniref:HutD/Ves family protein n=1 Tax=Streptomyces sp. (strain CB03234) TaxID=1703937 RepID=UPI00093A3465|nr:HutD family protein [Streptomyces sp. CB03234]OKK08413.1 HutD-family protein [Streptomyces sp. CB03234]
MSAPRVLRAADRTAVPWKNGGGVTREIAAWPEGSGVDGFDWRVSLADVGADGPFSAFPGTERILTVVDGTGMGLTVARRHLLAERYAPRPFPGEVATHGRLLAGPVVNLNVMHRRGPVTASVAVVRGGLPVAVAADATVLVVALDGPAEVAGTQLGRYDAVLCDEPAVDLRTDGHAAVVTLRRTG